MERLTEAETKTAFYLWRIKERDTLQIAEEFGKPESVIYNSLSWYKDRRDHNKRQCQL